MCQDDDDDDDDNDDDDGDGAGADDDACGGCGGDHMLGLFTTPDLRLTSTFEYPFLNPNQVGNMSIKVGKSSASSHNILSVTYPGHSIQDRVLIDSIIMRTAATLGWRTLMG